MFSLKSRDPPLTLLIDELLGDHPWDQTVRFDGSLSRGSSRFKGPPSKEVDQLWEELVPRK